MAVYKTRWFDRWARREGLTDAGLCAAVQEMAQGLVDADLGGGLVKKRIGRRGQGKSGGYRTLVATNRGRWRWTAMRKSRSPILAAVHDTAKGLHKAGVMDQVTLREFDQLCLPPVEPLEPEQIKRIRESTRVSQAVFARLLNTSLSTVQKWEIGQKKPTGTALKLLHLVQRRGIEVVA